MDKTIPELLSALRDGQITEELYNIILSIAKGKKGQEIAQGIGTNNEAEEMALDFILYLKDNLGIGDINSKSVLYREFNRWIAKTNGSENYELWMILSEALLELEKEGICQRGKEFKNYSNRNDTTWFLPKYANSNPDLSPTNPLITIIPSYLPVKRSADAKNKAKIIPPKAAKELVVHILKAVGGPVKMGGIVDLVIKNKKVTLTKIIELPQSSNDDGENKEKISGDSVLDQRIAYELWIQEEVSDRADSIWSEVLIIERGRQEKVQGVKILCLYILPATIKEQSINLEEFGPSSTVSDVKSDVSGVLKKYLSFEHMLEHSCEGMFPIDNIQIRIIQEINNKCSENGYDTTLNSNRKSE